VRQNGACNRRKEVLAVRIEERIKELGYELPTGKTPMANYVL
jgi:hypothetical protein